MTCTDTLWMRLTALLVAIAGLCFILYPAIRPFSDESTLQGAEASLPPLGFLRTRWPWVGFILLILGLLGLGAASYANNEG